MNVQSFTNPQAKMTKHHENKADPLVGPRAKSTDSTGPFSGCTGYDFTIAGTTPAGQQIKTTFSAGTPCGKVDRFLRQAGVLFLNQ